MSTVSVVGIGRLGLGFALALEKSGFKVIGVDKNQTYVDKIKQKKLVTVEPFIQEYLNSSKNFDVTTQLKNALDSEVIFVLVATPALSSGEYDASQIQSVVDELTSFGKQDITKHLVISCTVNPGLCDNVAKILEPLHFTVSYNPEFLAQGSIIKNIQNPDMVVIGEGSKLAGEKIHEIHKKLCLTKPVFHHMSRLSAEITKIALNCFMTTKISFANSIGDLARKSGAEHEKILTALGTDSKIGSKCLNYGFGYGGPCLPKDNGALLSFAKKIQMDLPISRATDETNKIHLEFQFNEYKNHPKDEIIVFDGVTYKNGTIIIEESQKLKLAEKLAKEGYKILVKDIPQVIEQVKKLHGSLFEYEYI